MQWRSSPWIDIVNTEAYILFVRSVIHTSTSQILKLCSLSKLIIFSFIPTSIHVPGAFHPRHNSPLRSSMRRFSPRRTKKTSMLSPKRKERKEKKTSQSRYFYTLSCPIRERKCAGALLFLLLALIPAATCTRAKSPGTRYMQDLRKTIEKVQETKGRDSVERTI
jgi:hypothetical protein